MAKRKKKVTKDPTALDLASQAFSFSKEQLESLPEFLRNQYENYRVVPVALLRKAPWNYKTQNKLMQDRLSNNLNRVGQTQNIHTRELPNGWYEVFDGNHRLDEFTEKEQTHCVIFHHGEISKEEAIRRAFETNETNFEPDEIVLASLLKEVDKVYDRKELMLTLPILEEDYEDLLNILNHSWAKFESEIQIAQAPKKEDGEIKPSPSLIRGFATPDKIEVIRKMINERAKDEDGRPILISLQVKMRATEDQMKEFNMSLGKSEHTQLNTYKIDEVIEAMKQK